MAEKEREAKRLRREEVGAEDEKTQADDTDVDEGACDGRR